LIKPGYDYGISSIIREELLIRAMAREIDGNTYMSRALVEASVAGSEKPSALLYRKAVAFVLQGNAMIRLHPIKDLRQLHISKEDRKEINKMVTLLKVLKHTDFYEKMANTLKAA
jgi:hypothetical protein